MHTAINIKAKTNHYKNTSKSLFSIDSILSNIITTSPVIENNNANIKDLNDNSLIPLFIDKNNDKLKLTLTAPIYQEKSITCQYDADDDNNNRCDGRVLKNNYSLIIFK